MNDILFLFLSLSLSGSILALILLAIKPFVKNKLSQTWQYYIWLVVILRFLLPFTPQVSIIGEMTRQLQDIINPPVVSEANPDYGVNEEYTVPGFSENPSLSASQNNEPETPALTQDKIPDHNETSKPLIYWSDVLENIWLLWATVALALFVHKATSYQSFVRFVNAGKKKITDSNMLGIYADKLSAAKIRRQLPLFVNEQVASPMLVGIFKPTLVFPVLDASDDEIRQIFQHEITHYKRWDSLYKWIVQITLCLHWFNPLVYLINKQINKSCELSCDESVIKHLDEDGRITYGDALMASLTAQGKYSNFVVSITMSENVNIVKERLDMIMGYKKKSGFVFCITAMLTVIMLCGFTVAGAYAATQPKVNDNIKLATKDGATETSGVKQAASYVIECVSEEIIVKQEGSEFKVEPDPKNQSSYRIRNNTNISMYDRYYRYNKWDVIFERTDRNNVSAAYSHTVIVTIPADIDGQELLLITNSGDIHVTNLNNVRITVESKSGNIYIADTDTEYISAETVNGNIEFKNVTSKTEIQTRSINGTVSVTEDEADAPNIKNAKTNKQGAEPYWTEEEFIIFMQEQKQGYKALLAKGDITQEEYEIFISTDKDILRGIQNGAKISKSATGSIYTGIMTPMKTIEIKGKTLFLIDTEAQLRSIGSESYPLSANYMLNADIALSKTEDWIPIGTFDKPFTGTFNGNGFEIIDLTIKNPEVKIIGMFAYAKNASIYNVVLRNPDIESAFSKGDTIAPILAIGLGGNEVFDNQINTQDTPDDIRKVSLEKNFEKYKPFGVVYNSELDVVFYNGERVRLFADFKQDKEENMDYAFDLCFHDSPKAGKLCIEAIEDKNGKITGIRKLDDDVASQLLRDFADAPPVADNRVLTFDATLKMESYDLVALDLTKDKAPTSIAAWIADCDKQKGSFIKQSRTDSGYITYIYYNKGGRYPWNVDVESGKVCVYLYSDSDLATDDGYTLLYYTTPAQYETRLYLDAKELVR